MEGRNSLILCLAECKRLLEIALTQEMFLLGKVKVIDIKISRKLNRHEVEISLEGVKNVNE